jgi:hypothetical protein
MSKDLTFIKRKVNDGKIGKILGEITNNSGNNFKN